MAIIFNNGEGGYICDNCNITILNYLPFSYHETFFEETKKSGIFKGITIWAKEGRPERFCSAKCMKEFFNENTDFADILYHD